MSTSIIKLQAIRAQVAHIPGLESDRDFDIALEIGFHQQAGRPLTLKQLLLRNISSSATVRRHLSRLIKAGVIVKELLPNDHRTVQLMLSPHALADLDRCLQQIHHLLCSNPDICGIE